MKSHIVTIHCLSKVISYPTQLILNRLSTKKSVFDQSGCHVETDMKSHRPDMKKYQVSTRRQQSNQTARNLKEARNTKDTYVDSRSGDSDLFHLHHHDTACRCVLAGDCHTDVCASSYHHHMSWNKLPMSTSRSNLQPLK